MQLSNNSVQIHNTTITKSQIHILFSLYRVANISLKNTKIHEKSILQRGIKMKHIGQVVISEL